MNIYRVDSLYRTSLSLKSVIFLIFYFFCNAGLAQPNLSNKIKNSKEELLEIQHSITELRKEINETQNTLTKTKNTFVRNREHIDKNEEKIKLLQNQYHKQLELLSTLETKENSIQSGLQKERQLLANNLYQYYVQQRQLELLPFHAPNNIAGEQRRQVYYRYIAEARQTAIHEQQQHLNSVIEGHQLADTMAKDIKQSQLEQHQLRDKLVLEQEKYKQKLEDLQTVLSQKKQTITQLIEDEKNLTALINKLIKESKLAKQLANKKAQKREKLAAIHPKEPINKTLPIYEDKNTSQESNFEKLKGSLLRPVQGKLKHAFGSVRKDTGLSWKGIFIESSQGNAVKAIADGKVIFAEELRGFGKMLIIDHGSGYMSLYGNNDTLSKATGDPVKAGTVIASVGNSGQFETIGLYFELRKNSKPFNPTFDSSNWEK